MLRWPGRLRSLVFWIGLLSSVTGAVGALSFAVIIRVPCFRGFSLNSDVFFEVSYFFSRIGAFRCLFSAPGKESGFIGANVIKPLRVYDPFQGPGNLRP